MKFTTNGNIYTVVLDLGESLLVKFHPQEANTQVGTKPEKAVTVATMSLPGETMALRFDFPIGKTYRMKKGRVEWVNSLVVLNDSNEPEEIILTSQDSRLRYHFRRFGERKKVGDEQ